MPETQQKTQSKSESPPNEPTPTPPKFIRIDADHTAIVDADNFDWLSRWTWRAVQYHKAWYAHGSQERPFATIHRKMHRMVACTPARLICHHRNRNSMDNRRANLINMTREEHQLCHRNNTLVIKFADTPEPPAAPTSS